MKIRIKSHTYVATDGNNLISTMDAVVPTNYVTLHDFAVAYKEKGFWICQGACFPWPPALMEVVE